MKENLAGNVFRLHQRTLVVVNQVQLIEFHLSYREGYNRRNEEASPYCHNL
jgi:hypothetical protein